MARDPQRGKNAPSRLPEVKASWDRRGSSCDRRVGPVEMRLRKGFWFEFHRKTELGKFDPFPCSIKNYDRLVSALVNEATRYEFRDKSSGTILDPTSVIDEALNAIRPIWSNEKGAGEMRAVILIDRIAGIIDSKFNLSLANRRASS